MFLRLSPQFGDILIYPRSSGSVTMYEAHLTYPSAAQASIRLQLFFLELIRLTYVVTCPPWRKFIHYR